MSVIYRALRRLDVGDDVRPEPWRPQRRRPVRRRRGIGLPLALVATVVLPAFAVVVLIRPEALIDGSVEFRIPMSTGAGGAPALQRSTTEPARVAPIPADSELATPAAAPVPDVQLAQAPSDPAPATSTPVLDTATAAGDRVVTDSSPALAVTNEIHAAPESRQDIDVPPLGGVAVVNAHGWDGQAGQDETRVLDVRSVSRALNPESALRTAVADGSAPWKKLERFETAQADTASASSAVGGPVSDDDMSVEGIAAVDPHDTRSRRTSVQWPGADEGVDAAEPASPYGARWQDYELNQTPTAGSVDGAVTGTAWMPVDESSGYSYGHTGYGDAGRSDMSVPSAAPSGEVRMSVEQVAKGRVTQTVARDLNRAIRRGDTALADEMLAILTDMAGADSSIVLKTRAYRHLVDDDGQDGVAMQLLHEVLIRDPADLDASLNLTLLEIRSGHIGDARRRLDGLAQAHPDDPRILALLASVR